MESVANINNYIRSGKRVREVQGPNGMKRVSCLMNSKLIVQ